MNALYQDVDGDFGPAIWIEAWLWIDDTGTNDTIGTAHDKQYYSSSIHLDVAGQSSWSHCYRARAVATGYAVGVADEKGSPQTCIGPPPAPPPPPPRPPTVGCDTDCPSPIVFDLGRGDYSLTGLGDPVRFDLDADGLPDTVGWTAANAPLAFLALDRNGNGAIDDGAELFGNHTPLANGQTAANGFEALAALDANHDGRIDRLDPVWPRLLLWTDRNHDGISTSDEIRPVNGSEIVSIGTAYAWTGRRDALGNRFRYAGLLHLLTGYRVCYDIYFVAARQ